MPSQDTKNGGVQHYLIESASEALRRGDKSAAKSCLLTARYLSVNDSIVTYEIYQMAKSDGDVVEASKCFTNIFLDQSTATSKSISKSKKLIAEETRLMINDLLHRHLKMKSVLNLPPAAIKTSSLSTSSLAGKRRSSSDTLVMNDYDTDEQFYHQLYETLSDDIKKAVLTRAITECDSKLGQCRLMLLFLVLFPTEDNPGDHGTKLLETLLAMSNKPDTCEDIGLASLMSIYYLRGLFVSDALPLILKNTPREKILESQDDILLRIFSFYIEFCISSCSVENSSSKMLEGHSDHSNKQTNTNCDKTIEKEHKIENQFKSALHSIANILGWNFICETCKPNTTTDCTKRWSEISDFSNKVLIDANDATSDSQQPNTKHRGRFKKLAMTNDDGQNFDSEKTKDLKQLFYSLVELLFLSISQYLRYTKNYILIEKSSEYKINSPSANSIERVKKVKLENTDELDTMNKLPKEVVGDYNISQIDNGYIKPIDERMESSFLTAVKCYEKLTSSKRLKALWDRLHDTIELTKCYGWQRRFQIDHLIYSGSYQQAIDITLIECKETNPYIGTIDIEAIKLRTSLQLTSCSHMLGDKSKTTDYICNLMEDIKNFHIITGDVDQSYNCHSVPTEEDNGVSQENKCSDESKRNLAYLSFNSLSFLTYCIDIILQILKQNTFSPSKPPDSGIGHLIVLSQYMWPKECKLFRQCVYLIRKHKPKTATPQSTSLTTKFTYHSFFNYVYNPCIIEEFMALLQQGYTLDIKSAGHVQNGLSEQPQSFSSSSISTMRQQTSPNLSANQGYTSTKAITTRGVNKSFKEDMKSALTCQMKKSTSSPNIVLFIDFLLEEVLPSLKDRPQGSQSRNSAKTGKR